MTTSPRSPSLLAQIASDRAVDAPVAVVVAHPDDETIALGSRLARMRRLKLVHLTDGSPRCLDDARRAGCADGARYAARRRRELDAALAALGLRGERISYGHLDQEAIDAIEPIVGRLVADLDGVEAVLTHPYEHGHPDHDSAALAVAIACRRLAARARKVPQRLEFASYHLRQGRAAYGVFWPDAARPESRAVLDADALAAKRAAIACHASQHETLALLPLSPERVRVAPDYDFASPAPPRECLYDRLGWDMTSARWRAAAARAWNTPSRGEGSETWLAAAAG
ncbi:MAG: PIG-L family deacetylase [Rhizobacter sp.]|nr:PIG-L family deacetylase [Rhizobacter sp.]